MGINLFSYPIGADSIDFTEKNAYSGSPSPAFIAERSTAGVLIGLQQKIFIRTLPWASDTV
jgi:hypothetical protein